MDIERDSHKTFEDINMDEIKLLSCRKLDERSGLWDLKRHSHPYTELIYFPEGKIYFEFSGDKISVFAYNLVLYPKGVVHKENVSEACAQEVISLGVELPDFGMDYAIRIPDRDAAFAALFANILAEYIKENRRDRLIGEHIQTLLRFAISVCPYREPEAANDIETVVRYLKEHFTEPVKIQELADLVHVSNSYLIRSFKRKTRTTPLKYIHTLRIEAAKYMLQSSKKSVESISACVGFNSPKYFSRVFKMQTGTTARSFKR